MKHADFMQEALKQAKDDWTVAMLRDFSGVLKKFYIQGVLDSANIARQWGEEAGGGAGDEGYKNLAQAIRRNLLENMP